MTFYMSKRILTFQKTILALLLMVLPFTIYADKDNQALSLQKSLRKIAKTAIPAVVNIRAEKVIKSEDLRKQFGNDPFFDFFFKDDDKKKFFFDKPERNQQILGSGFIVSEKGYILTNYHVIAGAENITVLLEDEREYEAKVVGGDQLSDVALIKINPEGKIPHLEMGDSSKLQVGDFVVAIGNPFGLKGTFTFGVVSGVGRTDTIDANSVFKNYIQTDASINQGNSGGPLINMEGKVIGMNSAIFSTSGGSIGIGFAVPINIVKDIANQLANKGKVERGYIGAVIQNITKDLAKHFDIDKKSGVLVNRVEDGGPADKAGLKSGDIILKVNNKKVSDVNDVIMEISKLKSGTTAILTIMRNKTVKRLKIEVTKRKTPALASVKKSPKVKGWLGLSVTDNNGKDGVVIVDVDKNAEHELRKGDVILTINYVEIKDVNDFKKYIKKHKSDKSHLFRVKRGEEIRFIVVNTNKEQ